MPRLAWLFVGLTALLGGCPAAGTSPAPAPKRAAARDAGEPSFRLSVDAPASAQAGQDAVARVRVQPDAPWHVALDAPAALSLDPPADVRLTAPRQAAGDAERLDAEAIEFAVRFTPHDAARGRRTFKGELQFGMCADAECSSQRAEVEFSVDVACDSKAC